jgi:two-component system sensor histidine kinase/response regulator
VTRLNPGTAARPACVLIVDDERHNRDLLKIMLSQEGLHLLTAASGEQALSMLAQHSPDLVLLDAMMPGMDGYQVARRIKSDPSTRNVPVIMVTALDDRGARLLGLQAGAEDFLSKPVDRAELCVRVGNFLRLKACGDYYNDYSRTLEGEVASRTADLAEHTQSAAIRDKARGEELRYKDEFLSHVSHELRSPLTAIKQFTSILLSGIAGELTEEQREYQAIVLRNVRQLQSMIDDLLEVTRSGSGKVALQPECVRLVDVVAEALDTFQLTALASGVRLWSDLPPELPPVFSDPTRLRQMLIILLDNAIKFSSSGGSVGVCGRLSRDDSPVIVLQVSDTGCGISPEISERIFERLYQVPGPESGGRKGLGLGLHICKGLVEQQGGRIWVESQLQKGSTFSFTLPVFVPAAHPALPPESHSQSSDPVPMPVV